jgi:hypothetical protein
MTSSPELPKKMIAIPKTGPPPFIGKAGPPLPINSRLPLLPKQPPTAPSLVVSEPEISIFPAPLVLGEGGTVETRKIHWQAIPASRFKGSVFDLEMFKKSAEYVEVESLIDFQRAKSHFVKVIQPVSVSSPTASLSAGPSSVGSSPQQSAVMASVLPVKRSQQIEIFLTGRKNLLTKGLKNILKSDFESPKTLDLLEAAAQLFPTDEEEDLVSKLVASGDHSCTLARAESFLLELASIPQFKLSVSYVNVLVTAGGTLRKTSDYFEKCVGFMKLITTSKPFVKLLKLIGIMVVYLSNGKKTNFNGFALESVTHLKKVSSFVDRDFSVLNLVVEAMNPSDLDDLIIHLSPLDELLEFDFGEQIEKSIDTEKAVKALDPSRLDKDFHSTLIQRLSQFSAQIKEKIDMYTKLREQVVSDSHKLLRFVAENEKRNFNEVLSHLNEVRNDLVVAKLQRERRKFIKKSLP